MPAFEDIVQREAGLQQQLSAGQMTMIAIGGAVGTGLFLGSGFAIGFAGPSVTIAERFGGECCCASGVSRRNRSPG